MDYTYAQFFSVLLDMVAPLLYRSYEVVVGIVIVITISSFELLTGIVISAVLEAVASRSDSGRNPHLNTD